MALIARHPRPKELEGVSIEEIARRYVARFGERKPDWHAFADAALPGYRRAQHRFIGNTSGKPDENFIPARAFTLSVMLQGRLIVFFEEEDGRRIEVALGPWDCVSCPPGVIHGYRNDGVEPVYLQVMAGKAQPEFMGYADPTLFANRDAHTRSS